MRNTLSIIALSALLAGPLALAAPPEGGKKAHMDRLKEQLELTDEQAEEIRDLRDQGASRDEIRAVLTDEQRAQMDEIRSRHASRGGPEKLKRHLDLTDEQVEQIREIRDNGGSREEVRAVLTAEQQQKMDDMHDRRGDRGRSES